MLTATPDSSSDVLSHLFHRSWFNRTWTVQETAFSRDYSVITIYNGPELSDQLSWHTMILAIDVLTAVGYP